MQIENGEVLINIVVYRIFNELKTTKKITRIWLEDQTKETIHKELLCLKPIEKTKNLYNEGLARTYLDWLYGIYLTRYVSILSHSTYNVGRVIIPTVKFVYDRDMEIKNFVPKNYFEIAIIISKENQNIKLNFKELKFSEDEKEVAEEKLKEIQNKKVKIINIEKKEVVKKPNKLFSLSTLQNYMNKTKKFSLDKTLSLVQSLYEKDYLTYPRTNTEYLAEEEKDKTKSIINNINKNYLKTDGKLEFKDTKNIFDSSKVESHSAITPTTKIANISTLSDDEKSVYLAVLNRFMANFCKDKCLLNTTTITFNLDNMKTTLKGNSIIQEGYLKFENNLSEKSLPTFIEGEEFTSTFEIEEKQTTPPNKVTETEINKFFEKPFKKDLNTEEENDEEDYKNILKGVEIGTPATRSVTVEKVKKIGYIKAEKNNLSITEKGISFIETLNQLNINLYKEKTVELSQNLKKVYSGEKTTDDLIKIAEDEIKQIINQKIETEIKTSNNSYNKNVIGKCPICGKDVIENSKAYGCSGYKEGCKFTIWKTIAGKKITKSTALDLINKGETKEIQGFKSKAGKIFNASLIVEKDGKISFNFAKK